MVEYERADSDRMQCYTELIPPSAVTHAVSLPFLESKTESLVVAKTSLLQIFDLKARGSDRSNGYGPSGTSSKLVLVGEYPLAGTVTSLAAIKALNTKSGGDALLIAFKDAKLSLVQWDPENYKISTISIHYYEGENVTSQPFGPSIGESNNILTVDPSSRCAALKFGARHLAILPFRQLGDELMEGGDEGYDPELDIAPPSATIKRTQSGLNEAAENDANQTPYKSSFVLPLTVLDPGLTHTVDLAFLHEYREPTFGILSATVQPSNALLEARKDILSYTVFTLDLEQRASTNLISAQKLPSDLWKIVPLPLPVGGALLVGTNELVHVDQSGKTNAVAVNEFARIASGFGMADQSALNLRLENCEIEFLDARTGDVLIVLDDGSLAVLSFRLLGRNVGGLHITRVTAEKGGSIIESAPSCIASLNSSKVFIGSEDGDSTLLRWMKPTTTLSRKRSYAQMLGQDTAVDGDEDAEDLDDDDLYATASEPAKRTASSSGPIDMDAASAYQFEVLDNLPSLGPINNVCFGRPSSTSKGQLELLAGTGRGPGSRLALMSREVLPDVVRTTTFDNARDAWTLSVNTKDAQSDPADAENDYHNMLFCYDGESTKVYDINRDNTDVGDLEASVYTERTDTDFEQEGETIAVSTLSRGSQIVQCGRSEIRVYDATDLSLNQIIDVSDEETDTELKTVHASFCDPYMLIIRDDSSVKVLQVEGSGEVNFMEKDGTLRDRKWLSGCLYSGEFCDRETVVFLLGDDGGLHLFTLPDFEPFFSAPMLSYLPPVISQDAPQRRVGAKETLTEILIADIGTKDAKQPYLILRSAMDDLTLYSPWSLDSNSWKANLRFRKVPLFHVPKFDEIAAEADGGRPLPLRAIDVGEYAAIHVPGAAAHLIMKEASSLPKVLGVRAGAVKTLIPLNHRGCDSGFGILDGNSLKECQFPVSFDFSSGWYVRRMTIGQPAEEVRHIAFHEDRQMYVVATCRNVDFYFPEEDGRHQDHDGTSFSLHSHISHVNLLVVSASSSHASQAYTSLSLFFRGATSIVDARSRIRPPYSAILIFRCSGLSFIPKNTERRRSSAVCYFHLE